MSITHVVVSDLHLGAANSLLTNVRDDGSVGLGTPSPVLDALMHALRPLLAHQSQLPTLVLAGDIFELALTSTSTACETFSDFIRLVFNGERPMFAPDIVYIAGNHDHHLWELAREHQYVSYVATTPPDRELIEDWQVTHLFPANDLLPHDDRFVTTVANRAAPDAAITVRQTYPNFGIVEPGTRRTVVVSHGHYTEAGYRAMELVHTIIRPTQPAVASAWHMEADNHAWVDFVWSTLGRSGDAGVEWDAVHEMLQSEQAVEAMTGRVIDAVVERRGRTLRARVEAWVLRRASRSIIRRTTRLERHQPDSPLSAKGELGLQSYLRLAVAPQLLEEAGRIPDSLTFVFGHTHKPFARSYDVDGLAHPVDVFNTGGWVVDSKVVNPMQGAAIILIDDQCRVVALDLYRQGSAAPVAVVSLDDAHDTDAQAFADDVRARVSAHEALWAAFSAAASSAVATRRRQLLAQLASDEASIIGRNRAVAPAAPGPTDT